MPGSVKASLKGLLFCGLTLLAGCATTRPPVTAERASPSLLPALARMTVDDLVARALKPDDVLLIGAGDIADCGAQLRHAKDTAAIIQKFPGSTVFTAGDDAYNNGTDAEFKGCSGTAGGWGRFKERTRPSPGNHEYGIYEFPQRHNANPYFDYFGTNAGPRGLGYYSYELGGWHIVSLNSMANYKGAPTMTAQRAWLETDLAGNKKPCILAYWHHPLFSSGDLHGDDPGDPGRSMTPLWDVL